MANFKGGFAFNNEAAKVEVEQSPNGALISCINPVTGESMGGGNPNSVQVIEGTAEHFWGDLDFDVLCNAIINGNASAIIVLDLTVLSLGSLKLSINASTTTSDRCAMDAMYAIGSAYNLTNAARGYWEPSRDNYISFNMYASDGTGTDITSYAPQIPTTLTIYWHPMPETEGE